MKLLNIFYVHFQKIIGISLSKEVYSDDKKRLQARIVFNFQLAYIVLSFFYVFFYLYFDCYISASACFFVTATSIVFFFFFFVCYLLFFFSNDIGVYKLLFVFVLSTGGPDSPGIIWQLGVIIGTFLQLGKKQGLIMACYIIVLFLTMLIMDFLGIHLKNEAPYILQSNSYILINVIICTVVITFLISIFTEIFEASYGALKEAEVRALVAG
jgi:hypothetical protein